MHNVGTSTRLHARIPSRAWGSGCAVFRGFGIWGTLEAVDSATLLWQQAHGCQGFQDASSVSRAPELRVSACTVYPEDRILFIWAVEEVRELAFRTHSDLPAACLSRRHCFL